MSEFVCLAIDTSSPTSSVAVCDRRGEALCFESACSRGSHNESLPELVQRAAEEIGGFSKLELLAYGQGPGSFTGLRISLGMLKGISIALKIPLVGVSSFDAQAALADERCKQIIVISGAGREGYFVAEYERENSLVTCVNQVRIVDKDEFEKQLVNKYRHSTSCAWISHSNLSIPSVRVQQVDKLALGVLQLAQREQSVHFDLERLYSLTPNYVQAVHALTIAERLERDKK